MPEAARQDEVVVIRKASARIPTAAGEFQLFFYENNRDHKEHLALVRGDVSGRPDVLVRLHSECFTGDVLGSRRCDCGEQLQLALKKIAAAGNGIILYLRQEGRGIGLLDKLRAYNLQDLGYDTAEANLLLGHEVDERDYTVAGLILRDLGVDSVRLLTNNPDKIESLEGLGITVAARVPLQGQMHAENATYLRTKASRMNHLLILEDVEELNGSAAQETRVMDRVKTALGAASEHRQRTGMPLVTLSYAQSLDGSVADRPGRPLTLSGSQSMIMTHGLRAAHDAILVGIGTVLADNPRLNVRLVTGKSPQPVIVDSRLRFPPYANLLRNGRTPWIVATEGADPERRQALEAIGARVFCLPGTNGLVNLETLLQHLGDLNIDSLMVEGGAQIITSFLSSRLVDQIILTIAPLLVGGLRVVDSLGRGRFPRLSNLTYQRLGEDLVLMGEPEWKA
ncbi:MAG: GTP cyclohydrolase II [Deltaproteobacteria bacterium]|nr:GTP cyclohydrolase II [Deltaproteobacteria bacterium]